MFLQLSVILFTGGVQAQAGGVCLGWGIQAQAWGVSAQGVSRPRPRGVSAWEVSGPGPGGVYPGGCPGPGVCVTPHALRQTPPTPSRRLLLQMVRILLECILVGKCPYYRRLIREVTFPFVPCQPFKTNSSHWPRLEATTVNQEN